MYLLGGYFIEFSVQLMKGSACCLIEKYLPNYSDMNMDNTSNYPFCVCAPTLHNTHIVMSINNSAC